MELDAPQTVDNPWAALATIITALLTVGWGVWQAQLTRRKDKEEKGATDLRGTIDYLLAENRDKSGRLERVEQIANNKYPAAVDHIVIVHRTFPAVRERVPIPRVLYDDIDLKELQGEP